MFQRRPHSPASVALRAVLAAALCLQTLPAAAQPPHSLTFRVTGPAQKLEMVVNSSRIVEMDFKVPRMLVENPTVLRANPLSPTQVQLAAMRPGVTHVTLWDETGQLHSLDVIVIPDARELEYLLQTQFPDASLKVRPLSSSVAISGYCPSASMVSAVVAVAEDYYPRVINNIEIGGTQQVLLHVKVLEVSRTKLRALGVDWALFTDNFDFVTNPSGIITSSAIGGGGAVEAVGNTIAYSILDGTTSFFAYIEALRRNNLIKVLSEPTLTTVSGRAASFNVGGEFPIIVPQSLGTVSIEYRQFGTRVDFVPIVHGNGSIRLEVRPQVSEIDSSRSVTVANTTVPGLRSRWVDTAAEMRAGQTLALAGLLQNRVETETRIVPVLGDIPWVGAAFRSVRENNNEVELLIMVTPELVEPMDKHEVPPCGPGQFTTSPNDAELYGRGYIEVPKCCENGVGYDVENVPAPAPNGNGASLQTLRRGLYQNQTPAPVIRSPQGTAPVSRPLEQEAAPVIDGGPLMEGSQDAAPIIPSGEIGEGYGYGPASQPAPVVTGSPEALGRTASYRPHNPQKRQTRDGGGGNSQVAVPAGSPGLIGPSGYDEIK